jgi:hypothetical protein
MRRRHSQAVFAANSAAPRGGRERFLTAPGSITGGTRRVRMELPYDAPSWCIMPPRVRPAHQAGCKPALGQIANLRYGGGHETPPLFHCQRDSCVSDRSPVLRGRRLAAVSRSGRTGNRERQATRRVWAVEERSMEGWGSTGAFITVHLGRKDFSHWHGRRQACDLLP